MFTLSVIWGLAVILPGLVFHLKLFSGDNPTVDIQNSRPSTLYLVSISLGTIASHLCGIILLLINHAFVRAGNVCLRFDPSPYDLVSKDAIMTPFTALLLLMWIILYCVMAWIIAHFAKRIKYVNNVVANAQYGALAPLYLETIPDDKLLMVYVITNESCSYPIGSTGMNKTQNLGYRGILKTLIRNGSQYEGVHINDAEPFYIDLTQNDFITSDITSTQRSRLEHLYIPQTDIKNLAFRSLPLLSLPDAEEA